MILVIKHLESEGPGTLGKFLRDTGWVIETIELSKNTNPHSQERGLVKLASDLSKIDAVICMGGSMNVYEEDKYPFLKEEDIFIKKAIKEEIPFLGICLGAQLLAKACGADVKKAQNEEIGWYKVSLTDEGKGDRFFRGLEDVFNVFQWHGDTFEIPKGAVLLVTADTCKNQAFRFGKNAYAIQFHIEITDSMIGEWAAEHFDSSDAKLQLKAEQMIADYNNIKDRFDENADKVYINFSNIIVDDRKLP